MTDSLPSKLIGETLNVTFDFQSQLRFGETLSTPVVTVELVSGIDYAPEDLLTGTASVSGGVVTQKINAGMGGVSYILTCTVTGSSTATYVLNRRLSVLTDTGSFHPGDVPALTGNLPDGIVGAAYSSPLDISGGYAPYTPYSIGAGSAPAWMGFSVTNNKLICAGLPDEPAATTYVFTPRIRDAALTVASSPQEISITRITIAGDLGDALVTSTANYQYTVGDGTAPYTFDITITGLPTGTSINSAGLVTGVYSAAGPFSWTVRATDANGVLATLLDSNVINPLPGWISTGGGVLGYAVLQSPDGLDWTGVGYEVPNFNFGSFLRRASDGAVIVYNVADPGGYKFGISYDDGQTFSMYNTVGMNSSAHFVGYSGGYWHCSSNSAATRVTDAGVQTQVASSQSFGTMCIGDNSVIGFKLSTVWHADVSGDNWVETGPLPSTGVSTNVMSALRGSVGNSEIGLTGYEVVGTDWRLHVLISSNNGNTFTDTTPIADIPQYASNLRPRMWYDETLNMWAIVLKDRVAYGPSLGSLTLSTYTFPNIVRTIGSDGVKFIFSGDFGMIKTTDFVSFSSVYSSYIVQGVVALTP